ARACGFFDQSHFTRAFVKAKGTTPAQWRKSRLS
ncbi:helix-turn-helix domain-containing protein, partial [Acinetobacter baumannii]